MSAKGINEIANEITTVPCPICHKSVEWSEKSPFRPFCSKRCQLIDLGEWDHLVETTYGKPYNFQQQNGCQSRGTHYFKVPDYCIGSNNKAALINFKITTKAVGTPGDLLCHVVKED